MQGRRAWNVVWLLGLQLSALVVATSITTREYRQSVFSSDHLYIPVMFADLTRWNGSFADWNLTPAPYLFPDMLLYGVAALLTPSVEAAQYLTCFLQLVLIIVVSRELLRRALPDHAEASVLIAPTVVAWAALYHVGGAAVVGPTFIHSTHGGALLSSLAVFTLCYRPRAEPRAFGALAVAAISVLSAASDALFFLSCSAMLAVTALCLAPGYLRRRKQDVATPLLLGRCLLAAACGALGVYASQEIGIAPKSKTEVSIELAIEDAQRIWNLADSLPRTTLFGLAAVSALASWVILRSRREPSRAGFRVLAAWLVLSAFAVTAGVIFTGGYGDRWSLRYFVVPCNLALVFLTGLIATKLETTQPNLWPTRVAALLTITFAAGLVISCAGFIDGDVAAPQRTAAQCVRDIAEREGVDLVVSDYWTAKPLMLMTDDHPRVVQIDHDEVKPSFCINSRGWYRHPGEPGILITNGLDSKSLIKRLGSPQAFTPCDDLMLFIYRGEARARMADIVRTEFGKTMAESDAETTRRYADLLSALR